MYYLSNYITDILLKYTSSNLVFDMNRYFKECYLYNSDVFGLMTVYYNFFEINIKNIELNEDKAKSYLNRVRSMLIEHIYTNGETKININKLIRSIKNLNSIVNYDNKLSSTNMKNRRSISSESDASA